MGVFMISNTSIVCLIRPFLYIKKLGFSRHFIVLGGGSNAVVIYSQLSTRIFFLKKKTRT